MSMGSDSSHMQYNPDLEQVLETSRRLLLVEDDRIASAGLRKSLMNLGYKAVEIAESGEESLSMIARFEPELLLMDISLPGRYDGIETAKKIKEQYDIPVVFITGHMDDETLQRAKTVGPYGYVLKPIRINELTITIKLALHRHNMEKQFREDSRWFSTMVSSIGDAVIATDRAGRVNFINHAALSLAEWNEADVIGKNLEDVFIITSGKEDETLEYPLRQLTVDPARSVILTDILFWKSRNESLPIDCTASAIIGPDNSMDGTVFVFRDVTDRKQAERWMRYLAFHDILTGLPNRTWLYDQLKTMVVPFSETKERRVAIMFLDLDDFKSINDSLGHDIGDDLLRQVAERLTKSVRSSDIVGRLAGDEFIVIMDWTLNARNVEKVAKNIVAEFQKPFTLGDHQQLVTMSIGISIYPDDSENFEKLIKYADEAMYRAKQYGKNSYKFFSDSRD